VAAEVASAEAASKHLTPVDNRGSGTISRPFFLPRSLLLRLASLESIRESVGVGHQNRVADCTVRTPPRKIRHLFQECKYTLLVFLVGKSCELRIEGIFAG